MDFGSLAKYGFDSWFIDNVKNQNFDFNRFSLARVTAIYKNFFKVINADFNGLAELTGKLLYSAENSLDLPVIGDWVLIEQYDIEKAFIHEILPRKTLLKRKQSGMEIDFQPIAANIDKAMIIQSVERKINVNLIERFLTSINQGKIKPVILLSKTDLIKNMELNKILEKLKTNLSKEILIIPYSLIDETNLNKIHKILEPFKTHCLLGTSGAGKSSLINALFNDSLAKTNSVRQTDSKGKHTTTNRNMVILENGAMIIDNPGIREFGTLENKRGIAETFPDINLFAQNCKFKDCTHTNEIDCAVLNALAQGKLSSEKYDNYIKLVKENNYYNMSYVEKRRKDKKTGKLFKQMKKEHKKWKY